MRPLLQGPVLDQFEYETKVIKKLHSQVNKFDLYKIFVSFHTHTKGFYDTISTVEYIYGFPLLCIRDNGMEGCWIAFFKSQNICLKTLTTANPSPSFIHSFQLFLLLLFRKEFGRSGFPIECYRY